MFDFYPPKSVVVGIDGSQAAMRAAVWAVDEVAGTDIPLRLLYIREPKPTASPHETPHETREALATAEEAIHDAYGAINATGKPVKVETEILEGQPLPALIRASDSTPLLCVGGTGSGHPTDTLFGSTAAELVHSAHCSVAVIRGRDALSSGDRPVVARIDGSPGDSDVVQFAFEEAQRRTAPLWMVTAWQTGFDDLEDDRVLADRDRRTRTVLGDQIARWTPRYPQVKVRTMVVYSKFLNYLAEHAKAIQLVVLGADHAGEIQELVGPAAAHDLRDSDLSLLVVRWLPASTRSSRPSV